MGQIAGSLRMPTFEGVVEARSRIAPHLPETPLYRYRSLDLPTGAEIVVKHENHLPTGAFKVRGGVNLISRMSEDERAGGVIAASTGNHGQSVAYAARLFDVRAIVCVPENANPAKVGPMRDLGAEIVERGRDFDEAREHCEELAARHGYRYIHSGDEPYLIEGVGTHTLEILEDDPEVEAVVVPVGGGSGAAGACIVGEGIGSPLEVFGVQSSAAPAAYRSWKAGELLEDEMGTHAEGLATRTAFALPQAILRDRLDDFVLVSDDDIGAATLKMIEHTRNLIEGAGAAPLAAALGPLRDRLAGRRVALIASGGNISLDQLRALLGA